MPRWKSTTGIRHQQTTGPSEFQVINPQLSQPILNAIKPVLAGHSGFTASELDHRWSGTGYRNFEAVIEKARAACFNSGQRIEDHFVELNKMIEIGKGGQRPVKTVILAARRQFRTTRPSDSG